MMDRVFVYIFILILISFRGLGQDSLDISGQLSGYINIAPENDLDFMVGGRYLPEVNEALKFKNDRQLDFEVSVNVYGTTIFHPFDFSSSDGGLKPYRVWIRYSGKQFELRMGLQKINFGSATFLRPLQWFDDIDPRDPLQFSNGVYGLLGRYYFLNNTNIWLWALYGNENPRGFELIKNNKRIPEFGGRVQLPVPKGEVALSFHHRIADSRDLPDLTAYEKIPEDKFGLDAKWDVTVGLWVEAAYVHKEKNVGILTNQAMVTLGSDYTFGMGNGLNVSVEHLFISMDKTPFGVTNRYNISAVILTYPVGIFDRISGFLFYLWDTGNLSVMMNYEHDFNKFTGYVMPYYSPKRSQNIFTNRYAQSFSGPGIRIMVVFNH